MNNSKKSLLMSSISLLLCISMFIGSTFAWFTDSASSAGNKIHSGILKLDVELLDKATGEWSSLKEKKEPIFNYDKWEPGYMDAKVFKIQNEGNLALKWVTKFYSEYELSILADVIDVYVRPSDSEIGYPADRNLENYTCVGNLRTFINSIEETTYGNLEPKQESYLGIALKMREEAGNEYQGLSLGGPFDIRIYATQYTSEYDSFGKEYDKGATFDELSNTSIMATASNTLVSGADSVDFDLSNNGLYVAKVIVPASAIADPAQPVTVTFDGIKPSEAAIIDDNTQAYAYDIKVSNLKENLEGDQLVTVVVTAPNALPAMKAYHNGTLIENAVYDEVEGTITFKTANFSPYAFTAEVIEVSNLAGMRKAVIEDNVEIKLTQDIEIDLSAGSSDRSIEHVVVSGSDTYYNAVNIGKQNISVDLNGHNITVKCSDAHDGNQDVGALFFVDAGGSLNIVDRGNGGFIKMRSSIYAVWAPYSGASYMDIYSGAFIADSYASDPIGMSTNPGSADGTMQNENSNRALVYAGTGGNMNIYGGYFLYNNTPNDVLNRNNGAFNCTNGYEGDRPFITIHDGVMLIDKEYRQNPEHTNEFKNILKKYPNAKPTDPGIMDNSSIKLEANCGIKKVENRGVTIDGINYPTWYRVSSDVPVSLVVKGLQNTYARNDVPSFTVTVNYTYGSKVVTDYEMTAVDMSTAGIKNATISYTENGKTLTTDISFKVNAVSSIMVEAVETKFEIGETIPNSNFKVTAINNEGEIVKINSYTIGTIDTSSVGEKTVTVSYVDAGVTLTGSCKITVVKKYDTINKNSVRVQAWNNGLFAAGGAAWADYWTFATTSKNTPYNGLNGESATGANVTGHAQTGSLTSTYNGYGSLTVTNVQPYSWLGVNGYIGFQNKEILEMGYYVDGDRKSYVKDTAIFSGGNNQPGGAYQVNYQVVVDASKFDPGTQHTITYVVVFADGMLDLFSWNITMAPTSNDTFTDTDKPNVNVVILAGQSNAAGASPITQDIRGDYGNADFKNVFLHYANVEASANGTIYHFKNNGFDKYQLGIGGWGSNYFGPELGLAKYLSTEATTKDQMWYIIKFAPTGTTLANQWLNGGTLANEMITFVQNSINTLSANYDVQVRSFVWMQGENDATTENWANNYATNEQSLVSLVRNSFAKYATRSKNAISVPGSGIDFVSAGIAPNGRADGNYATTGKNVSQGGPNDWIYATYVNQGKYMNSQYWYLPTATVEGSVFMPGIPADWYNNNPSHTIKNSVYIDTAALSSKAVAIGEHGDYSIESDKTDWAHYSANSMLELGKWFGYSIEKMISING